MAQPLLREDLEHVLRHTRDLWDTMRGQRIFITGGTGFFGCWLLETFAFANDQLALGAEALVLTRDIEKFRGKAPHLASHPAIELIEGDVRSFVFPGKKCSHIVHAAATSSAIIEPLEMLDTIAGGTRRTLDFAVACGAKGFLLISSGAVYGQQPPELTRIPETYADAPDVSDPNSAYGEGKRVAELLCAIYAKQHSIETKIARCFAFVGPHLPLNAHFAIGNFIRDALADSPIRIEGDGSPFRSYLYAADLAIWLWTILFRGPTGCVYNVGSSESISILDVAQAVLVACRGRSRVVVTKSPEPDAKPARYVPDTTRAQRELALYQTIDLMTAISKTAQWLRNGGT